MWNTIKGWFAPETQISGTTYEVIPQTPTPNPQPASDWRRGMWIVFEGRVGILADFIGKDVVFHEVNVNTGETEKEVQVSMGAIRQAKYYEVPACRMSVSKDVAKELGYGD